MTYIASTPILTTLTEVTDSRAAGSIYQNTSGGTMICYVSIESSAEASFYAYVENTTPPTIRQNIVYQGTRTASMLVVFVVPNNEYYKLVCGTGTPTISEWFELTK